MSDQLAPPHRQAHMEGEADSLDGEMASERPATGFPEQPAPRGYQWRATMDLVPGMVIAKPVVGITGSRVTLHLATGSVITANTLAQLVNKAVECVAVRDDHPPTPEIYAAIVVKYEARLREIFEPLADASCRPLFEALVKNGPGQC